MMDFEKMDRQITLQVLTVSQDGAGQPVESWSDVATVWAWVRPFRGGERFTAQQIVGKAVTTFVIRYLAGVTVTHRIAHDGRQWDIHDIREVGRHEGLEIDATARSD